MRNATGAPKQAAGPFRFGITMEILEILPFVGVGAIRFGMPRADVRALLGSGFTVFRKTPTTAQTTDAYDELGVHIEYDLEERACDVETYRPERYSFRGLTLFAATGTEAAGELRRLGNAVKPNSEGFLVEDIGVSVAVSPADEVKGVCAFSRQEFERVLEVIARGAEKAAARAARRAQGIVPPNPFKMRKPGASSEADR